MGCAFPRDAYILMLSSLLLIASSNFVMGSSEQGLREAGAASSDSMAWWEAEHGPLAMTLTHPMSRQAWEDLKLRRAEVLGDLEAVEENFGVDPPWPKSGTLEHSQLLYERDLNRFVKMKLLDGPMTSAIGKGRSLLQFPSSAGDMVIQLGNLQNSLYYAKVKLGSSSQPELHLQVDTGSDLFWAYCDASSTRLRKGVYNFRISQTGQKVGCQDPLCVDPTGGADPPCDLKSMACTYKSYYADNSGTQGILVTDTLVINNVATGTVLIGCALTAVGSLADHTGNIVNGTDGIIGMGRGDGTIESPQKSVQMMLAEAGFIPNIFSVCLTHASDSEVLVPGGVLMLGNTQYYADNTQSVDLVGQDLYYVPLVDMSINGYPLCLDPIDVQFSGTIGASGTGTVLDTGYTYGNLPANVYNKYMNAMDQFLGKLGYTPVDIRNSPNPCYDASSVGQVRLGNLPTAELIFDNGAHWAIPQRNLFYTAEDSLGRPLLCLPISTTTGVNAFVIGDSWLRNNFITFDITNSKIYFSPRNCSTGQAVTDIVYRKDPGNGTCYFGSALTSKLHGGGLQQVLYAMISSVLGLFLVLL